MWTSRLMMECGCAKPVSRQMFRGDTFVFDVQVYKAPVFGQPEDSPTPPQDITGWKMWFTAKNQFPDPDRAAVVQLDNASIGGIAFIQPTNGLAEVTMSPLATYGFADGPVTLVYDVQVKDLSGRLTTVEQGTLTVYPDVTRALS